MKGVGFVRMAPIDPLIVYQVTHSKRLNLLQFFPAVPW